MIESIIHWAQTLTDSWGYWGIFITQTLESALIPIPSEAVVTFGGFMASIGQLNIWFVILIATLANVVGSVISYYLGVYGGRPILEKYGKYVLIPQNYLERMDGLFENHKRKVAFIARLLPGIRTISSLIIGSGRMNFGIFLWYTLWGSLIWNGVLGYAGYVFGENWELFSPYFKRFEIAILILVLGVIIWFIWHRVSAIKKENNN